MIDNILGYALTADVYYRLWMVANHTQGSVQRAIRHSSENWHPALISEFNDVRDVPSMIVVKDSEHKLDNHGRFHCGNNKPAIEMKQMSLYWGDYEPDDVFTENVSGYSYRPVGPCEVHLSDIKMWHHQNDLHRKRGDAVIMESARFNWNTRNRKGYYRESGPYQIIINKFTSKARVSIGDENRTQEITNMKFHNLSASWVTSSGVNISESRIRNIVTKNQIRMNYLIAGESVFQDPGEEFIFWDEMGGNL